ncbi:ABC transporter permease [Shewanella halotolerans]|uniref:ABC transporter permease n=1 Tax=Shewanella halotolerans TaxID=2864204 RepID=UPI001C660CE1|nr:ABC transporter permease [Shewanella halotolerans]QYJ89391.1 FtsX-like permease family protein [Shewanella halotolerans]
MSSLVVNSQADDGAKALLRATRLTLRVFAAHYKKAPLQAGAILIGIVLAVTLLTGVRATNESAIDSYGQASELLSGQASNLVTPLPGKVLSENLYFDLRAQGFHHSLAVLQGSALDSAQHRWQATGSDLIAALSALAPNSKNKPQTDEPSDSKMPMSGPLPLAAMLAGEPIVVMSETNAKRLPEPWLSLNGMRLKVVAVDESYQLGDRLLMDISLAQQLLGKPGELSYIALFDSPREDQQQLLTSLLTGRGELVESDNGEAMKALTNSFHLNLTAMSLLAFIVGLFIAYNGVRYSLLKRKRLIIQLQQQGVRRAAIMFALGLELTLLVLLGSLIGFFLGLQLSFWLQPMVSVTLEQLYGANILPGSWRWQWLAQASLLTLSAALLACGSLLRELLNQPLAQSSGQLSQQRSSQLAQNRLMLLACLLGIMTLILMPLSQDYRFTMALLGLVVIAIPLALPYLLRQLIGLLQRISPKGLIGYQISETRELLAPLSLAMMAMLLALTANIAMNSLVGSFEITLKQWLDARLHAQLYLRPPASQMAEVEKALSQAPEVTGLYKQWLLKSHYQQTPIFLLTRDPYSIEHTTIIKQARPDLWRDFFSADPETKPLALVSEPFAFKQGKQLGDKIQIAALGETELTIGAIYYDYGNPYGEVIIPPSLWRRANLGETPLSLALTLSADVTGFSQQIQTRFQLPDALVYSQEKIKAQAITMFKRTFSITQVLNSLTLMVAAIGLFSACYMLTQARLAPIARLYALGVNRRQLVWLVVGQMLLMVLLTCLVALPTGALLGYLLIHKVTLQAFGWTIAMVWDWLAYLELVGLALLASTLALAFPLYQQTRRPLVSSLQREVI